MGPEQISFLLIMNVCLLPLLIIGVVLCCGKGGDLIAGFNTASPRERAKWNEPALCRGVGVLVLLILACIETSILGAVLNRMPLVWAGIAMAGIITVAGLLYINKSKRFRK